MKMINTMTLTLKSQIGYQRNRASKTTGEAMHCIRGPQAMLNRMGAPLVKLTLMQEGH